MTWLRKYRGILTARRTVAVPNTPGPCTYCGDPADIGDVLCRTCRTAIGDEAKLAAKHATKGRT